jgi:hypothetical protein
MNGACCACSFLQSFLGPALAIPAKPTLATESIAHHGARSEGDIAPLKGPNLAVTILLHSKKRPTDSSARPSERVRCHSMSRIIYCKYFQ